VAHTVLEGALLRHYKHAFLHVGSHNGVLVPDCLSPSQDCFGLPMGL
jgi:hypothetical protein